jgi:hypothetical protein
MKKLMSLLLTLSLLALALNFGAGAVAAKGNAAEPAAASDELIALLPASDGIAVVDVGRIFGEIIPQIRAMAADGGAKFANELDAFVAETGLDPSKITAAVIGFKMSAADPSKGDGAAIIQGLTLDLARIEAAVKLQKGEFKTVEYKGQKIYVISSPKEANKGEGEKKDAARLDVKEDMAFVQLEGNRISAGSLDGVKAVVDAKGAPATAANAKLSESLKQTPNGLIRFAVNIPPSAAQALTSQGDLFAQMAAIKMVFGSFDLSKDFSATLDAKMRTGTNDEATQIAASLNGLVEAVKPILGGNSNPLMDAVGQALDKLKIGSQATDVSLTLVVPRAVFDALAKSGGKKAESSAPKKP